VLIVTHDRAVLRGVATQVWEIRDERVHALDGSFLEWETLRAEKKANAEREARDIALRESERATKARAAANSASRAASRESSRDSSRAPGDSKGDKNGKHAGKGTSGSNGKAGSGANDGDTRRALRLAQKTLSDAEMRVSLLESRIAELTTALEDTTLYDTPAGVQKATDLGKALDEARDGLDGAVHDWSAAAEHLQTLQAAAPGSARK